MDLFFFGSDFAWYLFLGGITKTVWFRAPCHIHLGVHSLGLMCLWRNVVKQILHVLDKKMQYFLFNNQSIAIDSQIDHPGSGQ